MLTLSTIQKYIKNRNIKVQKLRIHSKASEKYVDVCFQYKHPKKLARFCTLPV